MPCACAALEVSLDTFSFWALLHVWLPQSRFRSLARACPTLESQEPRALDPNPRAATPALQQPDLLQHGQIMDVHNGT